MKKMLGVLLFAFAVNAGAGETHLLKQPCRVMDTRQPGCHVAVIWPAGVEAVCPEGALRDGETRFLQFQSMYRCGGEVLPLGAKGLIATVTAVDASGQGHLVLFNPYPVDPWELPTVPTASTLNFPPAQATAVTAFTALGQFQFQELGIPFNPDAALKARVSGGGTVHVVIDVLGYLQ